MYNCLLAGYNNGNTFLAGYNNGNPFLAGYNDGNLYAFSVHGRPHLECFNSSLVT